LASWQSREQYLREGREGGKEGRRREGLDVSRERGEGGREGGREEGGRD